MDLQDHPRIQPTVLQPAVHSDHGALDDVRCGALHRRVDRGALGALAHGAVLRIDLRQVQPPTEQRLDIALLGGLGAGALHVGQHAGVTGEITVDVLLRFLAADVDLLGQAESAHAVDQAEVDRLGAASLVVADLLQRHAEHLGSGGAVHVEVVLESVQQTGILRQMSHDAQLDLRVVGREQLVARRRDEGLANTPALSGADRDVLQVRVAGGQPAGGGHRLVVAGVDAPGARVDLLRQLVGVGALELAQGAVLHDHLGQRVILLGQFGQHAFRGGRLAAGGLGDYRAAELVIEDRAELLGRAEVELLAGNIEGLAFQLHQLVAQLDALLAEQLRIDQRTVALDARQHRHQRHLDLGQHLEQRWRLLQLAEQGLVQAQGDIGVLGSVGPRLFDGDLVEGQLLGTLAGDVLEADGAAAEVLERQAVHVVSGGGGVEHIGFEHGVEGHAAHLDTVMHQHVHVVFAVLADLGLRRILQQRLERAKHGIQLELLRHTHIGMAQRHIGRLARLDGERHADQLGALSIDAGGFGIEGEALGVLQALEPGIELGRIEDRCVLGFGLDRAAFGLHLAVLAGGLGLAQQVLQPVLEFQLAVQRDQRLAVRLAGHQVGDLDVQRHVELDGRQLIGHEGGVAVFGKLGAQ